MVLADGGGVVVAETHVAEVMVRVPGRKKRNLASHTWIGWGSDGGIGRRGDATLGRRSVVRGQSNEFLGCASPK